MPLHSVLEKTVESPLDCKEIQPVHPTGNQSWIFIERTNGKALIRWLPDAKSQLTEKDPDAGKDWRQEERGMTEEEMRIRDWSSDVCSSDLWCWRRLLRVPWTARRSNQSILKEISLEYSLDGLMLKLKLQYFSTWCEELTHWKRPWCWERLKVRAEGDDRGWDGWMSSLTQWTWVWVSSRVGDGQGSLACCSPWGRKESDTTEQLNWTESKMKACREE